MTYNEWLLTNKNKLVKEFGSRAVGELLKLDLKQKKTLESDESSER